MKYHIAVQRSRSKWRTEAWLECSTDTLELFEVAGWLNETAAVLQAPIPCWMDNLSSRLSFGKGGLYDEARGSRLSRHTLSGELEKRFYDWTFQTASRQKIRLRQLVEGVFVLSSREQTDQFVEQSQEYISGLEVRVSLENRQLIDQSIPHSLDQPPYRNRIR